MLYVILMYLFIGVMLEVVFARKAIVEDCKEAGISGVIIYIVIFPVLVALAPIWFIQGMAMTLIVAFKK